MYVMFWWEGHYLTYALFTQVSFEETEYYVCLDLSITISDFV